ncbi:MAG: oxaloacetate decarboxylase [Bacteroides sp.]|nr:oxaloacetate decarboxylase [Bacteroides sp.]
MWQSSGKYQPRVDQLEKIAPWIVEMNCFARVETNGGAFEQVNLLYGENPNKAVRAFTRPFREAGIRTHMLDRGLNGIRMYGVPADVRKMMYKVKKAQGVDITRIFCGLNDVRNIIPSIGYALEASMVPQGTLCITHSPVHTVAYYTDIAGQLIEAGATEICLKDMAGVGRPAVLGKITRNIKEKYPGVLIQYHGHSGPGLSMASILEVCENGADIIDVAMEPISWGKVHPDVISVQAMLKEAGFQVPEINMAAYMKARSLTQEFIDDFLGYFMDATNRHTSSLLLGCGLPGGMMGSMMADLKGVHAGINLILKEQNKAPLHIDELLVMLFEEVSYVWPRLGYPPLVTPFSQYVKNVALMNVMQLIKGEERWTMIDRHTWDMILGRSGKLPGKLAPEIIELARKNGYEFTEADPQLNFPDELDRFRKEMDENGWEYGEDDEELFEFAMHDRQYRAYKSGEAKKRFEEDLQRAKDIAMSKHTLTEDEIKRIRRAKAYPVVAPNKGQVLWEVAVEGASTAPFIGRKYLHDEVFCYLSTPWGEYDKVTAAFTGRVVEICAEQGAIVGKGDVIAYIQRSDIFA